MHIETQTVSDSIAAELRRRITNGLFESQAPLRQELLAAEFGVSRIPVREALRKLEAEGLVRILPNRGAFVIGHTAEEIQEIYSLRLMLEIDLLARAVPRFTKKDLEDAHESMAAVEAGAKRSNWYQLDDDFHLVLYRPAQRDRQLGIVMQLREAVRRYSASHDELQEASGIWLDDHRHIVAACENGDIDLACQILRRHLEKAERVAVSGFHGGK